VSWKRHIPNAITSGNLFCGCLAVVFAFQGNLVWTAYLVGIAAVLDFFDGFAARMLHVSGEMGKQLDSLADMVTFGLVPGVVIYQLMSMWVLRQSVANFDLLASLQGTAPVIPAGYYLLPPAGFLVTVFSALRLAKFNIDERQANSFIGLPTPANTILICSLPLMLDLHSPLESSGALGHSPLNAIFSGLSGAVSETTLSHWIINPVFLLSLTLISCFLMVAELPLFALKFKNFGWKDNKLRYGFLLVSLCLLIIFQYVGIPIIILLYVVLSVINNLLNKYRNEVQG
jgi:CDP-diacylglycerol--serine O-phosphatidyltransferase